MSLKQTKTQKTAQKVAKVLCFFVAHEKKKEMYISLDENYKEKSKNKYNKKTPKSLE